MPISSRKPTTEPDYYSKTSIDAEDLYTLVRNAMEHPNQNNASCADWQRNDITVNHIKFNPEQARLIKGLPEPRAKIIIENFCRIHGLTPPQIQFIYNQLQQNGVFGSIVNTLAVIFMNAFSDQTNPKNDALKLVISLKRYNINIIGMANYLKVTYNLQYKIQSTAPSYSHFQLDLTGALNFESSLFFPDQFRLNFNYDDPDVCTPLGQPMIDLLQTIWSPSTNITENTKIVAGQELLLR